MSTDNIGRCHKNVYAVYLNDVTAGRSGCNSALAIKMCSPLQADCISELYGRVLRVGNADAETQNSHISVNAPRGKEFFSSVRCCKRPGNHHPRV